MKILVVSQYFYPESFRINSIVTELVERNHEVTVLTGLPNYPEGIIYDGYNNSYKHVSDYNGASVYRCKLRPRKKGSFNLFLNYLSFIIQAKKTLKRIKPDFDIIFFYEPSPITSGIPAIWFGKKNNVKTIIYNMDIWPDCVRDFGNHVISKRNLLYLLTKKISKRIYNRFTFIINKCDDFGQYLNSELGLSYDKMKTIPEFAEDTYLEVDERPVDNGTIDFVFLGNIGKVQNCSLLLEAFCKANIPNTALHFVGDGSDLLNLQKKASDAECKEKVFFHGRCSIAEVINFYNLSDVCVLSLSGATTSGLTPPGKLYSYMAASRPIIASINGSTRKIISEARCGYSCPADDVNGLCLLIKKMCEQATELGKMGSNGRMFFLKNYSLFTHVSRLESTFIDVINKG